MTDQRDRAEPRTARDVTDGEVGRSVRWTYGMTAASLLIQFATTAVLARQLTAADYGTVAVAAGALRFLQYLTDLGLASVVIQKSDFRTDSEAPLLFAFGLAVHGAFAAMLWLASPLFLLAIPQLAGEGLDILRALAVVGVVGAAGQIARALLTRRLDFRRLGLTTVAGLVVGQGLVAIPLAFAGFGAWSLVAGLAAQSATSTALALYAAPHPLLPRRAGWARWRELAFLGGGFSILRILDSAGMHLLPVIVGALAGMAAVGQWDRAWVLSLLPIETLATGIGRVLFPAFSRLSGDPARVLRAWLSALMLVACLLGSVGAGLAVAAPQIVSVVLGADWRGTETLVAMLALWAVLRGLAQVTGNLCEGSGRLLLRGLHQTAYLAALAGAVALLRPQDGAGIAAILLAVEVASQTVLIGLAARIAGVSPAVPLRQTAIGLSVAPCVAAACAGALMAVRPIGLGPAVELTAAIAACAMALALSVAIHPSATLRAAIGHRVLGQALGISGTGDGLLSRLRRRIER